MVSMTVVIMQMRELYRERVAWEAGVSVSYAGKTAEQTSQKMTACVAGLVIDIRSYCYHHWRRASLCAHTSTPGDALGGR